MKNEFLTAGYRYCFICLLSIAIVCGSASDSHAQSYYPNDFGNTWVLRSTDGFDERVVTIEGPEAIGNEKLTVISDGTYPISDPTNNNPNKFFIKAEPDGVLIFRATAIVQGFDATIDYSPPATFLPIPIGLGSEWIVTGEAKLLGGLLTVEVTNAAKVVAVENVTVSTMPEETFRDCLKIEQRLSSPPPTAFSQQSTMWLAPNIGIVKSLNSSGVIFELIHYKITIDGIVVAVEPKGKLATTWGALKNR